MRVLAVCLAALALLAAHPAAARAVPAPPLTDADYFAVSDAIVTALEPAWSEREGAYSTAGWSTTIGNAALLTVFATAAAQGHAGPSRNDARARRLVTLLTGEPPFFTAAAPPVADKMFHTPGWTENLGGRYLSMDKSVDPKVAEALALAWGARDALGLDRATADTIVAEVDAVARTPFFRYPNVRLNQINWNAELYALDATLTGDPELLRTDYRAHLHAFTGGFVTPQLPGGSTNVGPSYRFTYQSNRAGTLARNLDSPEYASMTLHVLGFYEQALGAGMAPLPAADLRLLRGWTQRVLYGYWTHAGFLNWDTGWGYGRWMKGKTWAYAQQGLLAIATAPRFTRRPQEAAWAKWTFDRGLALYAHLGEGTAAPWLPSGELFGIRSADAAPTPMFAARTAANAARAVTLGLGRMPAAEPPPFYAYDADIGRLAVSTASYSTAILAVNRGKVPYGGIDLARLYDADGDPVGGTGGRAPLAFGVAVERNGRSLLETQRALHTDPDRPPLTLTRSPQGRVTRQRVLATQPDAGPFGDLAVQGTRRANGVRVTSAYRFEPARIEARWRIAGPRRSRRSAPLRPTVRFPSTGPAVRTTLVLASGRRVALTGTDRATLRGVAAIELRGPAGGYTARLRGRWRGTAALVTAPVQRANPAAGPTVALQLAPLGRRAETVRAAIVPFSRPAG